MDKRTRCYRAWARRDDCFAYPYAFAKVVSSAIRERGLPTVYAVLSHRI